MSEKGNKRSNPYLARVKTATLRLVSASLFLRLAQARKINAVLVTEASRWSRSTIDLISTLQSLNAWGVSLVAMNGLSLDLLTPQGKLMATMLGAISEFERDLIRERVKSGMAAAKAKGQKFGRPPIKPEQITLIYSLRNQGLSYSQIAKQSGVGRTKVAELLKQVTHESM